MTPGIILASYPNSPYALELGRRLLDMIYSSFPDATLYVGINYGPYLEQWTKMLYDYPGRVLYEITPEYLVLPSDASAYQTALRLYKKHGEEHSLLWFYHFKGTTHPDTRGLSGDIFSYFSNARVEIEQQFNTDKRLGIHGFTGWTFDHNLLDPGQSHDMCSFYMDLPYPVLRVTVLYSIFTCRGLPVWNLVQNCTDDFLTKRLGSSFFFENDFSQLIFRQGYTPSFHTFTYHPKEQIDQVVNTWVQTNLKD